ncbi:hypothetical protein CVT24_008703, partial [Panaeolus cyanescens]
MSGKAPPKGPRALLGQTQGAASSSSSSYSHPPAHSQQQQRSSSTQPPANPASRIGATPPTGPRSLQGNANSRPPPPGPKSLINGHSSHNNTAVNGLGPHALQTNRHPISIKGKKRDVGPSPVGNPGWNSPSYQPNGWPESNVNGNTNGANNNNVHNRAPSSAHSSPTIP